jgi:hypothetical protein
LGPSCFFSASSNIGPPGAAWELPGLSPIKLFVHRSPVLNEKDTVILADFANSTGDPVFDGTLRQGLAVELEQSPFLKIMDDRSYSAISAW